MKSLFSLKKIIISFLVFILIIVVIFNISAYYAQKNIEKKDFPKIYKSCNKIWSSRGVYSEKSEQNSIGSFQKAFDLGASGVEVDFYYDVDMDKFIVSHSKPKKMENGSLKYSLKDGKLLTLEEVFDKVGEGKYFWLDYKNLDRISSEQTLKAIKRLNQISKLHNVKDRLYIEGSNPIKLSSYTQAGFFTILGIHPLPLSHFFRGASVDLYKIAYGFFDISAVAMPYGTIEESIYTKETLGDIPVFLFHVPNDKALISNLLSDNKVRAMLVGRDFSTNRFQLADCK